MREASNWDSEILFLFGAGVHIEFKRIEAVYVQMVA